MVSFNFSFDPNVSSEQRLGIEMAGVLWAQFIADDMVINIHIRSSDELPGNILGGAVPGFYADQTYATVQSSLNADRSSSTDQQVVESLEQLGDTTYTALLDAAPEQGDRLSLNRANAKALGLTNPADREQLDGYIVFNDLSQSELEWDYDDTRVTTPLPNTVDFISVALHEIGHVLGFTSGLDSVSTAFDPSSQWERQERLSDTTILDLFRYSERSASSNSLELSVGEESYFSVDGGDTVIAPFATGKQDGGANTKGYQASHWQSGSNLLSGDASLDNVNLGDDLALFYLSSFVARGGTVFDILADAETSALSDEPTTQENVSTSSGFSIQVTDDPDRNPIGVMDPTLATGERTNISWVDLIAMDAIGYDLTPLGQFFVESKVASSSSLISALDNIEPSDSSIQIFNVLMADVLNESDKVKAVSELLAAVGTEIRTNSAFHQIESAFDEISLMVEQSELFERRRRRRRRTTSRFFQESDDLQGNINDFETDNALFSSVFQGIIQGQVRLDVDQDGDLRDADMGLEEVSIRLYSDFDQDGQEDGVPIATVITGDDGQYRFEDLAKGRYILVAEDLDGFFSTADRNGYNPNRIAFIDVHNNVITDQDFLDTPLMSPSSSSSAQPRAQGSIQGQVRHDLDKDGDLNDLDDELVGVEIQLFSDFDRDGREDGEAIATTQTNEQGDYIFTNLGQGRYIVVAEDLDGFFSTGDRNGYNPNRIAYLNLDSDNAVLTGQDFLDATVDSLG